MTPTTPPDPKPVTPFWTPLLLLFSSRAFLLALGTALVDALIIALPSLEPLRGDFMNTITVLIGLLIAKIGAEDIAKTNASAKVETAKHQANAAIATAQIVASKPISSPEGAPPVSPPPSLWGTSSQTPPGTVTTTNATPSTSPRPV